MNSVLGKVSGLRLGSQTEWKIQSLWTEPAQSWGVRAVRDELESSLSLPRARLIMEEPHGVGVQSGIWNGN